jgi:hypothetical protein
LAALQREEAKAKGEPHCESCDKTFKREKDLKTHNTKGHSGQGKPNWEEAKEGWAVLRELQDGFQEQDGFKSPQHDGTWSSGGQCLRWKKDEVYEGRTKLAQSQRQLCTQLALELSPVYHLQLCELCLRGLGLGKNMFTLSVCSCNPSPRPFATPHHIPRPILSTTHATASNCFPVTDNALSTIVSPSHPFPHCSLPVLRPPAITPPKAARGYHRPQLSAIDQ